MINDLKYSIRSREIVDLVNSIKAGILNISPYFQRNLVWRETHKRDFIDTILRGYPFPQIFLARGPIDLDSMTASQAVVDGQQRLNTIREYIAGKFDVDGKLFSDLEPNQKSEFLKYEVAVIDFDLDADDPKLKEVFHRLNRTYYALSAIEKLSSEYSASEFMLVARVLSGEITRVVADIPELEDVEDEDGGEALEANIFSRDPGIGDETWDWLNEHADGSFSRLIKQHSVFSPFEFDRKVPLMFVLNVMCTYMSGYYERNDKVRKYLDEKSQIFEQKQEVIERLNEAASLFSDYNFEQNSMWWNKANFFTLIVELARHEELRAIDVDVASARLKEFALNVPQRYQLDAREAVGRKPQRQRRGEVLRRVILQEVAGAARDDA